MALSLLLVLLHCAAAFHAPHPRLSVVLPRQPRTSCASVSMKEPKIRQGPGEPRDAFDEASAQQIPTLKFLAGFVVIFIGGQVVLGEEGTLAVARWLSEGPLGPIWNLLSQPVFARKEVVRRFAPRTQPPATRLEDEVTTDAWCGPPLAMQTDAAGVAYDVKLEPTSGLLVIVAYNLVRAAQRRMAGNKASEAGARDEEDRGA